jgi:hypothetical protein
MLPNSEDVITLSMEISGILAFLITHNMVFANLIYLDSFTKYMVPYSYKACMIEYYEKNR